MKLTDEDLIALTKMGPLDQDTIFSAVGPVCRELLRARAVIRALPACEYVPLDGPLRCEQKAVAIDIGDYEGQRLCDAHASLRRCAFFKYAAALRAFEERCGEEME